MQLRNEILRLIETDDSYNELNEERIIKLYKDSSKDFQVVIDLIFQDLTGYSLGSIINGET